MQSQRLLLLIPQPDLPSRYHPHSHKDNKTLILMVCMSEMYQRWPHGSRLHRTRIQTQSPFYLPCFYFKGRIPEFELQKKMQLMWVSQSFNRFHWCCTCRSCWHSPDSHSSDLKLVQFCLRTHKLLHANSRDHTETWRRISTPTCHMTGVFVVAVFILIGWS